MKKKRNKGWVMVREEGCAVTGGKGREEGRKQVGGKGEAVGEVTKSERWKRRVK